MHIPTWAAITTGLASIAGIVTFLLNLGKILTALGSMLTWCRQLIAGKDRVSGLPTKTIVAIQQPRINALWWHLGRMGERPMLQVVGDFNITNVWSDNVRLSGALLRYRRWGILSRTERGDTMVKDVRSVYSGDYPIPSNEMTRVRVSFHVLLKHREPRKRFKADLAIRGGAVGSDSQIEFISGSAGVIKLPI